MKILVTGTAGFIGYHLAKKLLERGDEVVGIDNINDYYDVNLKYARLTELGIDCRAALAVTEPVITSSPSVIASSPSVIASEAKQSTSARHCESNEAIQSSKYPNHKFIKLDISNTAEINTLFETQKFDAVMNLAAQAGVRYSLENPHAYIQSNIVGFLNILEGCRNNGVKNRAFASSSSVYGLKAS